MKKLILLPLFLFLSLSSYAQNELEPELKEVYFIDKNGERIEGSVSPDEGFIYLVIVSNNAIGEKVNITMDENESYFYKKQYLKEGSTIKIPISNDQEKVKLVIYNAAKKKHYKLKMKAEGSTQAEDAKE